MRVVGPGQACFLKENFKALQPQKRVKISRAMGDAWHASA
jgi:hypothetical protein